MLYPRFHQLISALAPLPEEEWILFEKLPKRVHLKKDDFYLQAGECADSFAYIEKGAFRLFYVTSNGDEYNQVFKFDEDLIGGYASLLSGHPSAFFIQAMEDSTLLSIHYKDFCSFFERHIAWERIGRKIAEMNFMTKELREQELLTMTAKERYLSLLKKRPDLANRVSQYNLASYLGVTPTSFNRILKEIKK